VLVIKTDQLMLYTEIIHLFYDLYEMHKYTEW